MDIYNLPVHPAADVWPMIDDEGLQQLADDIKANGLLEPIVIGEVDGEMMLVDGRNRLAACQLAEVEPTTASLNGHDPHAFILSKNENRRHITKGQRAMCVAMMFPEAKRGMHSEYKKYTQPVNKDYLSKARTVLEYTPKKARAVAEGTLALAKAYDLAKGEQTKEEKEANEEAHVAKYAPEYMARVKDEDDSLTMEEAIDLTDAKIAREKEANKNRADALGSAVKDLHQNLGVFTSQDSIAEVMALVAEHDYCREVYERYVTPFDVEIAKEAAGRAQEQLNNYLKFLEDIK